MTAELVVGINQSAYRWPRTLASLVHEKCAMAAARLVYMPVVTEQGMKLPGLLLTGSTGHHLASRNGLA